MSNNFSLSKLYLRSLSLDFLNPKSESESDECGSSVVTTLIISGFFFVCLFCFGLASSLAVFVSIQHFKVSIYTFKHAFQIKSGIFIYVITNLYTLHNKESVL